jgi:hypothetical protein
VSNEGTHTVQELPSSQMRLDKAAWPRQTLHTGKEVGPNFAGDVENMKDMWKE